MKENFTVENLRLKEEDIRRIAFKRASTTHKPRRKPFKAQWARLPRRWYLALRGKSGKTYELAHTILFEDFKRKNIGGDIVLSEAVTGMSRNTRARAADELVELGLIKVARNGKHALRVTHIIIKEE
jgi:Fic family protein